MGHRRPSVFLVVFLREVDRNTFFFFRWTRPSRGASSPCVKRRPSSRELRQHAIAAIRTKDRQAGAARPPVRRRPTGGGVRERASREVRRATSTKPPIPLAHALEGRVLHRKRGVARRRQGSRVALRLGRLGHAHITTQESHADRGVSNSIVGHVWWPYSSQPDLRAVILAEVDVARAIPGSEQRC